ncbi:adenylyltransferase and sulfurtransferase [Paenibacillus sp. UNCCL117]|uniref:ThiF family adenylyltransferase n=1 Tax=unclassified Paenibacillus TaxID=185978 RepID=UPI0008877306|nr:MULTISPECIES: ThiF family adenylyltransferase [unclassified Paenibacillus]SDC07167.1 adenylyltransferase and sulfurtransferase [Paenibacillus sp. cl123]SFW37983.1 adenylyltransferase and sulfurtransferase [Paenibacillus sp. UNCCL117]
MNAADHLLPPLTGLDRERYSRQMLFAPIGEEGQAKLLQARIAIVGMGALGTVLANHMARAGIGFIRIIDRDFVERSNLQRQMLYDEEDAASSSPKAEAGAARLRAANSGIIIEPVVADLNATNAEELLTDVDLILDGTDNFAVRFLINDVSVKHGIPWIYGGAVSSRGVSLTIVPGETPCLRCLFGQPPGQGTAETCDTAGVLGPLIHVVASHQATEALKLLVGARAALTPKMMHWDIWYNQHAGIDVSQARKADCPCCGQLSFDYLEASVEEDTIQSLCGRNSVQVQPSRPQRLSLADWEARLAPLGRIERNPFLLKLHLDDKGMTLVLFPDGRLIVQGTDDPVAAKSLYSRYIGM